MLDAIDWAILFWLLAGILSGIGEVFTGTLFLLPFAVGAFAAAAAVALGADLVWVLIVFIVLTAATLAWAVRYGKRVSAEPPATREGANRYVDAAGVVTREIVGRDAGRVRIGAEEWRALAKDGKGVGVDVPVRVVEVRGNALVVEPAERQSS